MREREFCETAGAPERRVSHLLREGLYQCHSLCRSIVLTICLAIFHHLLRKGSVPTCPHACTRVFPSSRSATSQFMKYRLPLHRFRFRIFASASTVDQCCQPSVTPRTIFVIAIRCLTWTQPLRIPEFISCLSHLFEFIIRPQRPSPLCQ